MQIKICIIKNLHEKLTSFRAKKIIQKANCERISDPAKPDNVLFGLHLLSLGPLKNFPIKKPPVSDNHTIATIHKR